MRDLPMPTSTSSIAPAKTAAIKRPIKEVNPFDDDDDDDELVLDLDRDNANAADFDGILSVVGVNRIYTLIARVAAQPSETELRLCR